MTKLPLCKCGCGERVKFAQNKYVGQHYSQTQEAKTNHIGNNYKRNGLKKKKAKTERLISEKEMYWFRRAMETSLRHQ